jgi:hypothetical protein
MYVLIIRFLERGLEDSELNGNKYFLNLTFISCGMTYAVQRAMCYSSMMLNFKLQPAAP